MMASEPSWVPDEEQIESARLTDFMRWVGQTHGVHLNTYRDVWRWSVTDISRFWESVVGYFDLIGEGWSDGSGLSVERMPGAQWFPSARLNFAENVLSWAAERGDEVAVVTVTEHDELSEMTWRELRERVGAFARWLRERGVSRGDRVAAVLPNVPEAVIGLLATASIGAIWTISSPELSVAATLGRLRQLQPRILLTTAGYAYNGKWVDTTGTVRDIEVGLPDLVATVLVDGARDSNRWSLPEIMQTPCEPVFERVPFDHPLWVLFSSGTTGDPKGIVHGHGGVLLEAVKATALNQDMRIGGRYYVAANTSWMVWNTLVMNMASGASVVTYAGSPTLHGPERQFDILARTRATMFATGAAYLQLAERAGIRPVEEFDLSALRGILSTGSPLPVSTWAWVHDAVKRDVHLGSDTGGTDICSGFVGSNPLEPVHVGLLQGPLLGVQVQAWDQRGQRVVDEVGDLVVLRPMPSMPLYFWGDADGSKYRSAYFEEFPNVWAQGDWITETPDGEFIVHGRSDATLNRQGVRIGPADIYASLRDVEEVKDSLAIGVELPDGSYYMPLFVVLAAGERLDEALRARINDEIRKNASRRHVPDEIIEAPGIPVTHANKKLEVPIKRLFSGRTDSVNLGAVANAETIPWYVERAERFRRERGAGVGA